MSVLPDWLTGYDSANADAAAAADARLRKLNEQDAATYGPEWYAQVNRDYATQSAFGQEAQRAEIQTAFDESLADSAKKGVGFFGTLFAPVLAILKAIPWWVWLAVAVGAFLYLGGGGWLRRKIK